MKDLTRKEILDCDDDPALVPVEVPEWGGRVYVRPINGAERDDWERGMLPVKRGGRGETNIRASLVALAACDANGQRLFRRSDIVGLGQKFAKALDRVFDAAAELNGITDADLEEMEKNSESEGPDDSPIVSPSPSDDPTSTDSSVS